jgi:hypothetical protein
VGSNAAYTQTINADIVLVNATLPANSLGMNGRVRSNFLYQQNNNANSRNYKQYLSNFQYYILNTTGNSSLSGIVGFLNSGAVNSQTANCIPYSSTGMGASGNIPPVASIDTAVAQSLTMTAQISVATDFTVIEGFNYEVLPS